MTAFSNTRDEEQGAQSPQALAAHQKSFDTVTIAFHWATVVFVLGLLATALLHAQSHDDATKALTLRIHRSVGVTVWLITVCRLVWRMSGAKMPPFSVTMTRTHRTLVQISEYCLYALLVIQPITGLTATITRGRPFDLFWWHVPPLIADRPALHASLVSAHQLGAWILIILISGHALNALIHYFVLRDSMLQRMAPLGTMQRR